MSCAESVQHIKHKLIFKRSRQMHYMRTYSACDLIEVGSYVLETTL